eukprot:410361_1
MDTIRMIATINHTIPTDSFQLMVLHLQPKIIHLKLHLIQGPASDPTFEPTFESTYDPTNDPTSDPTTDPTIDFTNDITDPTSNPTNKATFEPSDYPTIAATTPTNPPNNGTSPPRARMGISPNYIQKRKLPNTYGTRVDYVKNSLPNIDDDTDFLNNNTYSCPQTRLC